MQIGLRLAPEMARTKGRLFVRSVCKKHPKYQAKRRPRAACAACLALWHTAEMLRQEGFVG
jgi:hypothetical protein